MVGAIPLVNIGEDLIAAVILEVEVDIGEFGALHIQEALKDQTVGQRVDIVNLQAVQGQAGGSAATDAAVYPSFPGKADYVPDHEEVIGKPGLANDVEFVGELVPDGRLGLAVTLLKALPAQLGQEVIGLFAIGKLHLRQVQTGEIQVQLTHVGNGLSIVDGLRQVGKQFLHLTGPFQVEEVAGHLQSLLIVHGGVGSYAQKKIMSLGILPVDVVDVECCHRWNVESGR